MKLTRAEVYNVWRFASVLPIYFDGVVLTRRFSSFKVWALCWEEWRTVNTQRVRFRSVFIFFVQNKPLTNDLKFDRNIVGRSVCMRRLSSIMITVRRIE
jgi:hypothetical protein